MRKIVKIKFGSNLYGTATENSDVDLKSVYIPDAKDILLGRVKGSINNNRSKEHGEKNLPGEVDEECFSLQRYLQLLAEGQTVALDMLFAPDDSLIKTSDIWEFIRSNRHRLLSRKSAAFVGYCRQQANKYGIKGSRVSAVREALQLLSPGAKNSGVSLGNIWDEIKKTTVLNDHMQIIDLEQAGGVLLPHWEVCGRKFGQTTTIGKTHECLQKIMDNYGQRALAAEAQNGVDWKALSHAVRVANQAIELFETGFVTFPLPNAKHILDIKLGKLSYQEVAQEIEELLVQVEHAAVNSKLPESPDYDFIDSIVLNAYFEEVSNENHRDGG